MNLRDKLKFWIMLSNYVDMIVRGTSPLSLLNAIANSLSYVKAFGGTELLPENYIDSVTVDGKCEQRNLPAEYTQVNYVTNSAQTMINTGVKFDFSKNYEIELKASGVTGSWYILQARESSSTPISGVSGSSTGSQIGLNFDGTYISVSQISRVFGHIYYVKGTINNGNMTLYVKDETAGTEETVTGTYTPRTGQSVDICLFGNIAGSYVAINSDVYFARIKEDDNYIMDYVPCRQSATAGFYDKVSGTFKTASNLVADGNAVPTPDTPMDIVCNNGVLKVHHQSEIPMNYTLLDYVSFDGTSGSGAYVDTGIKFYTDIPNNQIRIKAKAKVYIQDNWQVVCGNLGSLSAYAGINPNNYIAYGFGANDAVTSISNPETFCIFDLDLVNGTYKVTNVSTGADIVNVSGITSITQTNIRNIMLGGYDNAAGTITNNRAKMDFEYAEIYKNGVLVSKLIPCKNNLNVVGVYDIVRNIFLTNATGSTNLSAGNAVNDIEIYTDGITETINVHSKNLFDEDYPTPLGAPKYRAIYVGDGTFTCSYSIPNQPYNVSMVYFLPGNVSTGANNGVNQVDATHPRTVTAVDGYVTVSYRDGSSINLGDAVPLDYNCMIEKGSTATDYEPYFDGGTATAEMLLNVDTYKDTQEIFSGSLIRNVGVKVMTGNETFINGTNGWISENTITDQLNAVYTPVCTHFAGTDTTPTANSNTVRVYYTSQNVPRVYFGVDKTIYTSDTVFKQYLADQYNAGTPVMIVYPLATSSTSTVTKQSLSTNPNYIMEVNGSLDNLSVTKATSLHTIPNPNYPLDICCNNGVLKYGFNYYSYNVTRQLSVENYPVELDRSVSYSNGVLTCSITGSVSSNRGLYPTWDMSFTAGHKYACIAMAKGDSRINLGLASIIPSGSVTGGGSVDGFYTLTSNYAWYAKLWECNTNSSARLNIRVAGTDVGQYASFKDILVIDLTAIFGAGNEPTTSSDIIQRTVKIYIDGITETLNIRTKNLFNEQWNRNTGTSTQPSTWGQVVNASGWSTSGLVPVKAGQQYTVSYNTAVQLYVFYYEADGTMQQSYDMASNTKKTFTVPAGATHIRLQVNKSTEAQIADLKSQLETGATATTYAPYYNGGTATAEMLLKVGTYQDVQSIIDGAVTRKVGVKVLDGSENITLNQRYGGYGFYFPISGKNATVAQNRELCTHFDKTFSYSSYNEGLYDTTGFINASTTVNDIKQWLADQYAAGTPVIVVYPLATPTTESVAGQTLQVTSGDNTLEITQASLNNLELEAKYKKQA